MKPLVEKLPLSDNTSFLTRRYRTPQFEVPWHQHVEFELILFTEGEGAAFIGNYIGDFKTDDVFFLGSNLPHTFQKANKDLITSAIVIQFTDDFWGTDLMRLPESKSIKKLLEVSSKGLKMCGQSKQYLKHIILKLEHELGFQRIISLCECLQTMASLQEYTTVSTQDLKTFNARNRERIDRIFQYTIENFQESVSLSDVAGTAGMSVPAFCNYFKKSTKKTYIDFLNEIRIGYACQLLIDTQKTVFEICYESGFNTPANFNKQFLKIKGIPPSLYRKNFKNQIDSDYGALN